MAAALDQLDKVKGIFFSNQSDFICMASLKYTKPDGSSGTTFDWGAMEKGDYKRMDPGNQGLPPGTVFQLYVDVIGGFPCEGAIKFVYGPEREVFADYAITVNGIDEDLQYYGIAPPFNP